MNESKRKKLLLGMLLFLVAILGWQQLPDLGGSSSSQAEVQAGRTTRPRRGRQARPDPRAQQPREVRELFLAALEPQPRQYEIGRNLWTFYVPPPPPPPPYVPPPPPRVLPPPPPPPVVDTGPRPPEVPFSFLGSFGPERRRIAVLTDGEEIINALEGEVVRGAFRVARIGYESVYIEYVDFPEAEAKQLVVGG